MGGSSQKKLTGPSPEQSNQDIELAVTIDQPIQKLAPKSISTSHSSNLSLLSQIEDASFNSKGIQTWLAFFLNFKSLVGVGILAFPHVVQEIGYYLTICTYFIILFPLIYCLDLMIRVADDAKYYEDSLEDFAERILGKCHKTFTIVTNFIFCLAVSIANVIFAVKFIQYATCQLGLCFAHSRLYINLIGLGLS